MPDWKTEVRRRLSRLNLEPAQEAEIVEELAQHLDDVYVRSLRSGATEAEAKRAALTELADADLLQKEMRRSQKPAKAAPVAGGRRTNFVSRFFARPALCDTPAAEEPGLHDSCCHRFGFRHRRQHRDL